MDEYEDLVDEVYQFQRYAEGLVRMYEFIELDVSGKDPMAKEARELYKEIKSKRNEFKRRYKDVVFKIQYFDDRINIGLQNLSLAITKLDYLLTRIKILNGINEQTIASIRKQWKR